MKLIIGIDADGVLTDMSAFNIREGKKHLKKEPVDINGYGPCDIFGISKKEEFKLGLKIFPKYINEEPPRKYVPEIIRELNEQGHELHEITARKFATDNNVFGVYSRFAFERWLKKHNMHFESIQYCSEYNSPIEKYIACSKLSVDVMIEDKAEVAMYLAEHGVKVILIDAPYNQNINHPNIVRVYNWLEVRDVIKRIEERKTEPQEYKPISREEKQNQTPEERKEYIKSYRSYLKNLEFNKRIFIKNGKKYRTIYRLVKLPLSLMCKMKVEGLENVPYQDGFIMASNHLNSKDQYYIGNAIGARRFCGLAASTIKNTFRGRLFSFTGEAVYVDRTDPESKKIAEEELCKKIINGTTALIFPEGTRKNKTEEGREKLQLPFKLGTVAIAQKTGSAIIPMSLYYGKEKYLKISEPIVIKPEDDIIEANKKLEEIVLKMTKKSIEEDNQIKRGK